VMKRSGLIIISITVRFFFVRIKELRSSQQNKKAFFK
jgi:hypothetical protein